MKVWIHLNGVQEGPYELEQLPIARMDASTPVWYEGLADWLPASEAPLVAPYFAVGSADGKRSISEVAHQLQQDGKCPPTYLVWSIVMTVVCCNPVAIIPIITGASVRNKYRNRDSIGAQRMSNTTAWWIMISIVTSLILMPLAMLMRV